MYSGAYGYFDLLLADPRFERQAGSSVFSLRHPDWNILGLDTAWDEGRLHGGQVGWLQEQLADRHRKSLLLSHHQLFSAYDSGNEGLAGQLGPLLEAHPVKAWFWGHEHRCVLYRSFANVEFGRCVGHGGIPVYMWHGTEDPYPSPALYEDRRCFTEGLERWAVFGFTVLDFDGPEIRVRYIDENGQEHHSERIR
jgi:3',5'-cyclic AMP phosphodiesterase CpdA